MLPDNCTIGQNSSLKIIYPRFVLDNPANKIFVWPIVHSTTYFGLKGRTTLYKNLTFLVNLMMVYQAEILSWINTGMNSLLDGIYYDS